METVFGCELHATAHRPPPHRLSPGGPHLEIPAPGMFYRLVVVGATVLVRLGPRGSRGRHEIHRFATCEEAGEFYVETRQYRLLSLGYDEVFTLPFQHIPTGDTLTGERMFLAAWTAAARGEIHAEGQLDWWLYFTGLLAEAPLCLRAAHYLEALRAGPYAEDRGGDRIVGLGTRFQAEQLRAGWRATPISPAVGQRQCGGAPRSAEILLSLVRDQDPRGLDLEHRARMADVAGRLARVR